jgi:transposase, IS5 family
VFDRIHARLVLEHLREPAAVAGKLVSALRAGGWLGPEDADGLRFDAEPAEQAFAAITGPWQPAARSARWTWEPKIPAEVPRLPEDLARVDALLDDSVFFVLFAAYFQPVLARLPAPAECYLRLMSLKFRHQLGDESSCAEVSELAVASYVYPAGRFPAGR